ncbi:MAG TPA: VOC family protein [Ktedonobacteraceae bacterium]|nr:VOC family protein [Ktedonobacteraceae bacterium]
MEANISIITLGVDDLEKSLAFYRDGLGLPTKGIVGTEFKGDETHPSGATVMFELQHGLILALYPRSELAKDANKSLEVSSSTEFSLGHVVNSKQEVDAIIKRAQAAGAIVTDEPHERPWGIYSGYFQDVDGHLWEVIWNPNV